MKNVSRETRKKYQELECWYGFYENNKYQTPPSPYASQYMDRRKKKVYEQLKRERWAAGNSDIDQYTRPVDELFNPNEAIND